MIRPHAQDSGGLPSQPQTLDSCSPQSARATTASTGLQANLISAAVGVFPFRTHMTEKRMKMGYVAVETLKACSLFPAGQSARGHIYHFSEILEVFSAL